MSHLEFKAQTFKQMTVKEWELFIGFLYDEAVEEKQIKAISWVEDENKPYVARLKVGSLLKSQSDADSTL